MTTPETSAKTESAGILFQALQSAGVEPDLAYRADDEVRNRAGQNVIAVISAKLDAQNSKMDAQNKEHGAQMEAWATALETKIEKQGAELHAKIDARTEELRTRMDAQAAALESRIEKQGAELHAKIDARTEELGGRMDVQAAEIGARIDAQAVRIDHLSVLMLRVIWPLIILLAVPIFGELYKTLSSR